MDHIDVEAVALHENIGEDSAFDGGSEDQGHQNSYPLTPSSHGEGKQHETLQRLAQAVTDTLLQCLKRLVHEELCQEAEGPVELSMPAPSEADAVAGAPRTISRSQLKSDQDHESLGRQEDLRNTIQQHDSNSGLVLEKVEALKSDDRGGRSQDRISVLQGPLQTRKPVLEHTRMIAKMAEEDIEAENEWRRSFRGKWRAGQAVRSLEDPWKHLWRTNQSNAEPLFRRCTNEEREGLQLDLIHALYFLPNENRFKLIPWRGLRALSCWVSLIGLRLNEICGNADYPFNDQSFGIKSCPAFGKVQILIECLWVCAISEAPRVGDVLMACYRRGVLRQPVFHHGGDCTQASARLRRHFRLVHFAIYLVNILYKHKMPGPVTDDDLEQAWSKPISVIEEGLRYTQRPVMSDAGRVPFLTVSDFNLRDLQKIGKLKIKWTPYWDEHLKLETKRFATNLRLYWFPVGLSEIQSTA
ncbi:MAG: hypothetical protein Q9215_005094 [Flavoplaca cf. flavocitrina]